MGFFRWLFGLERPKKEYKQYFYDETKDVEFNQMKQDLEDLKLKHLASREAFDMYEQYCKERSEWKWNSKYFCPIIMASKVYVTCIMIYPGAISKFSESGSYQKLVNENYRKLIKEEESWQK